MAGEKTALEMANKTRPLELEAPPEQIDLLAALGLPVTDAVTRLRAERTGLPGRPLNSPNRRTVEMATYLLSQYKSPLEVMAQIVATPIAELAAALECTKLEALQEIRLHAIALKDHLHSKMPVAVDVTNRKVIYLTVVDGDGGGVGGADAGQVIDLTAQDVTEAEGPRT